MKEKTTKQVNILLVAFALIFAFFFPIIGNAIKLTSAEEATYTNVLDDLQKDTNFKREDFTVVADDYSIQVIQIAESENKELFIYTYQPSGQAWQLQATELRMSTNPDAEEKIYTDYALTCINSNGTLYKYKVNDYTVSGDAERKYEVICIFRKWDALLNDALAEEGSENKIGFVSFKVGKEWTAKTEKGKITYSCADVETIVIEEKYVGMVRYSNGITIYAHSCDSYYIAFSTDKRMDYILEADVTYEHRKYTKHYFMTALVDTSYDRETPIKETVSLKDTDEAGNEQIGLFGDSRKWNRIQSLNEFIKENEDTLNEESKETLRGKEWVLRFVETPFTRIENGKGNTTILGTEVSNVSILRLKFKTDGKVYELGVVDNKQTGSGKPDNNPTFRFWEWLKENILKVLGIILAAVFFIVMAPYLIQKFFDFIGWVLKGGKK